MTHRLDVSSCEAVSSSSATVLETIGSPIEDAAHMPITRDLSVARPAMIQARVKNGCPEGGSGARRSTAEHPGAHLYHPGGRRSAHVARLLLGQLEGRDEVGAALIALVDLDRPVMRYRLGQTDAALPGIVGLSEKLSRADGLVIVAPK